MTRAQRVERLRAKQARNTAAVLERAELRPVLTVGERFELDVDRLELALDRLELVLELVLARFPIPTGDGEDLAHG